jgi:hypothetical protein
MATVIRLVCGPLSSGETAVLSAIGSSGATLSALSERTGLHAEEITTALAQLRRRGLITRPTPLVSWARTAPALSLIAGGLHAGEHTTDPLPAA